METLQRTANRGSISTGYDIDNSLKLESNNNEWLYRASPTAGNRQTYTFSFWIKRCGLGGSNYSVNASGNHFVIGAGQHGRMYFGNDLFQFRFDDGHDCRNITRVFRDTNAWYHFVVAVDTTIASPSSDRVKLYVNGESLEVDDHDGGSFPDQNDQGAFFSTNYLTIGTAPFGGSYNVGDGAYDMRGYLAEFCAVDGQQLAPTDFGEYDDNGIWIPKDVSDINFGSEGFHLKFDNSSSLGADSSGNNNNFTLNNIAAADQATDTPTNNFCTMNIILNGAATKCSFFEGATFVTGASSSTNWESRFGSFAVESGKWYMELKADGSKSTNNIFVGFCGTEWHGYHSGNHLVFGGQEGALAIYGFNGDIYGGTGVHGFRIYDEDIVAMMLDADNGAMYFKRLAGPNNAQVSEGTVTWSTDGTNTADPTSGASKTGAQLVDWVGATIPAFSLSKNVGGIETNFGGYNIISNTQSYSDSNGYGSFVMQPPSGYYALCTKNLAEYG